MAFNGQTPPRIVAVDYGKKRVGVAVSDPLRMFARPYGTFSPAEIIEALKRIAAAEGIELFLVGWPLTLDGEEGEATAFVQPFIDRLARAFPGIRVYKWDERFSSVRARQAILEAGVPRKKRRDRARVDAAAASVMLQEYLDDEDF